MITCTPSREPLLAAADLRDGALVVAMGSDSPGKRELAGDISDSAAIVVDDPVGALKVAESAYLAPDTRHGVLGDLGGVLAGAVRLPDLPGQRGRSGPG